MKRPTSKKKTHAKKTNENPAPPAQAIAEAPAVPDAPPVDPDAAVKEKLASLVRVGESARENLVAACMLTESGIVASLTGAIRFMANMHWPPPAPEAPATATPIK